MIGTALVFMLGAMVASLAALLFAPFFWRRAERFARRRFEAEIPASVREMQGEVDAARARAAFDLRGAEMRAAETRTRATAERSEAGRVVLENGALLRRQAELDAQVEDFGHRHEALERTLSETRGERDAIAGDRERLREAFEKRGAEVETLRVRHASAQARGADLEARLAAAERRLAHLERPAAPADGPTPRSEAPAPVPEPLPPFPTPEPSTLPVEDTPPAPVTPPSGAERLRAAIAAGVSARHPATPAQNAAIRERISDLAARILRRNVDEAGPASPLAALLGRDGAKADAAGSPSLAARVEALGAAGGEASPAPAEPVPGVPLTDGAARKGGGGRSRRRSRR